MQGFIQPGSRLIASVDLSLAFYTWTITQKAHLKGDRITERILLTALECIGPLYIQNTLGFASEASLNAFVHLSPKRQIPPDDTSGADRNMLMADDDAAAAVLYTRLFTAILDCSKRAATLPTQEHASFMQAAAVHLMHAPPPDSIDQKCGTSTSILQCIMLMLKLVALLSHVKYKRIEVVDAEDVFWLAISTLKQRHIVAFKNQSCAMVDELEIQTSTYLAVMIVPILRRLVSVGCPISLINSVMCLQLLLYLMATHRPDHQLGVQLTKRGNINSFWKSAACFFLGL